VVLPKQSNTNLTVHRRHKTHNRESVA